MPDRERVIKGLESLHTRLLDAATRDRIAMLDAIIVADALALLKAQEPPTSESISSAIECLLHPQDADDSDMLKAIDMAVRAMRLLKAQEPRIVTEADFKNADEAGYIPAWCEEKDTDEVYCECILIGALEDAKLGHMRWWTSRPTAEQMEEVKWE